MILHFQHLKKRLCGGEEKQHRRVEGGVAELEKSISDFQSTGGSSGRLVISPINCVLGHF